MKSRRRDKGREDEMMGGQGKKKNIHLGCKTGPEKVVRKKRILRWGRGKEKKSPKQMISKSKVARGKEEKKRAIWWEKTEEGMGVLNRNVQKGSEGKERTIKKKKKEKKKAQKYQRSKNKEERDFARGREGCKGKTN